MKEAVGQSASELTGSPPLTPKAKNVPELSLREAPQLGPRDIDTEHVLLGLARQGEGPAVQVLAGLGVSLDRVRQKLISLMSEPGYVQAPREWLSPRSSLLPHCVRDLRKTTTPTIRHPTRFKMRQRWERPFQWCRRVRRAILPFATTGFRFTASKDAATSGLSGGSRRSISNALPGGTSLTRRLGRLRGTGGSEKSRDPAQLSGSRSSVRIGVICIDCVDIAPSGRTRCFSSTGTRLAQGEERGSVIATSRCGATRSGFAGDRDSNAHCRAFRARGSDRKPSRYGAWRPIEVGQSLFTMPSSAGVRLERPH